MTSRAPDSFVRGCPTLTIFLLYFLVKAGWERIQILLLAGHHLPASKSYLNGVSLACRWWPNIECWLGSFVIFRGTGPILLGNPLFLWFFRTGPDPLSPLWGESRPPVPPLDPRMSEKELVIKQYTYKVKKKWLFLIFPIKMYVLVA